MLRLLEKRKRHIAVFLLVNILAELITPSTASALTSGPAQPEMASFEPVGTTDMVDPFTGDFTYNIPLMDVDGYPINISYHSGINMDQEASWVGLGWNINAGSITRNMRGLPDDFNGDQVIKKSNMNPNISYGVNVGVSAKLFGLKFVTPQFGVGIAYNNYTGYNFIRTFGISISISNESSKSSGNIHLGLSSSADGLDISPSVSYSYKNEKADKSSSVGGTASLGLSYNSRVGIKNLSLASHFTTTQSKTTKTSVKNDDGTTTEKTETVGTGNSISQTAAWDPAGSTYVPQIQFPFHTNTFDLGVTIGGVLFGVNGDIYLSGSYSKQQLKYKSEYLPAYGYLYTENGQTARRKMLDFNREKDGAFTEHTTDLPLTNFTYDVYAVTGQGVGGSYRAFRNEVGYVNDSEMKNDSENENVSGEIHFGETVHGDVDLMFTASNATSGMWSDDNIAANAMHFSGPAKNNVYENFFFKQAGEKNTDESGFYENSLENYAVRIPIDQVGKSHRTEPKYESEKSVVKLINSRRSHVNGRAKRNQHFQFVKYKDYDKVALQPSLKTTSVSSQKIYSSAKDDHIAEITTTKTDGTRYVYGIPAYNTSQEEVSFSVAGVVSTPTDGLVSYSAGSDDTENNSNGIEHFFSKTQMPAYAHSYMLTAVLSPDYVDVTGDGPTSDDLGKYTLFSYQKQTNSYKWRTPFGKPGSGSGQANYDAGMQTLDDDDKASYVRGEKETWYMTSVETKNYIAVFDTKVRRDNMGANPDGNAVDANSTQNLLRTITLYSKPDFVANGASAFAIKQVHFFYDYSLCQAIPNTAGGTYVSDPACEDNILVSGKLTLKKIWFTYGNSKMGQLSPYTFSYNVTTNNGITTPLYDGKAYERWGNYKPEGTGGQPLNADFPYTEQTKARQDEYARLWSLKEVGLPSGGLITIDLESDDYAYVQNKQAMQMFKITGSASVSPSANLHAIPVTNSVLTTAPFVSGCPKYRYLFFKLSEALPASLSSGAADAIVQQRYTKGIDDLYFRFCTNLNSHASTASSLTGAEYVSGYTKITNSGAYISPTNTVTNTYDYGWVELEAVSTGDKLTTISDNDFNPISKAAWQFARLHTPRLSYNCNNPSSGPDPNGSQTSFLEAISSSGFLQNIVKTFQGANGALASNDIGSVFDNNKSWVKLNNPYKNKLGGGCRVSQITISDEWATMISGTANHANYNFDYGQEYDYTTTDPTTNETISSGVASYEPSFGADENPFRKPVFQQQNETKRTLMLAPDNDFYLEEPFGECFFPSPDVGYSVVTVKNLQRAKVTANATGKVVYQFYTAKDFPTRTSRTALLSKRAKDSPIFKMFAINFRDYQAASEGYVVELNDMHGKPRSNFVYAEGQSAPMSGVEYVYSTTNGSLNNKMPVIGPDGKLKQANIGIDFDMVSDFRQSENNTNTFAVHVNLYFFIVGVYPCFVPPVIPSYKRESTRFRSAVMTKVVNRCGILEKTIAYDLSSQVATQNLLWNSETGEVALSKTTTEFNDDVYSFKYPAHWAYSGMGHAYINQGTVIDLSVASGPLAGQTIISTGSAGYAFIQPGDEILVGSSPYKYWVVKEGNDLTLRDKNGAYAAVASYPSSKIIRSGRRNMQAVGVGQFTSFKNPMPTVPSVGTVNWPTIDATYGIINATSSEFREDWNLFCDCGLSASPTLTNNPYVMGIAGNWRQNKQYTYLSLRQQSKTNDNSNIRSDGTLKTYNSFWNVPSTGTYWGMNTANWRSVSEVTEYSPYGFELENKDPLGRYSAAVYGYNNTLPVAVASNSQYRQTAYDGFEDYDFRTCTDDHFGFKDPSVSTPTVHLTTGTALQQTYQKYSHTGRRSILVPAAGNREITKPLKNCNSSQ